MALSDHAFTAITDAFARVAGIRLTAAKKPLVEGRLQKLALQGGYKDLDNYVAEVLRADADEEFTRVVDKLTTNETYFFREPAHFEHLAGLAQAYTRAQSLRVWSAASSSGEEAYSIAMLLAEHLGNRSWEVVGTDLSTAMVAAAQTALYPMERARSLPPDYLKRYCLRGSGPHQGYLLIDRSLRERVHFLAANLMQELPDIGHFDVIFLRNVLIYFDQPGKQQIVTRVLEKLRPGGLLYTGHAESLSNLGLPLRCVQPAVYACQ